jgi:hypothetical protein
MRTSRRARVRPEPRVYSEFLKAGNGVKIPKIVGKGDPIRLARCARDPRSLRPARYRAIVIGASLEVTPRGPTPQQQATDCEVRDKEGWRDEGSGGRDSQNAERRRQLCVLDVCIGNPFVSCPLAAQKAVPWTKLIHCHYWDGL